MSTSLRSAAVLALLLLASCAPAQPGSVRGPRPSADVITREEIRETGMSDLYTIVERLHPNWVRTLGSQGGERVGVFVDGTLMGGLGALRGIPVRRVVRIRYLNERRIFELGQHQREGLTGALMVEIGPPVD